MRTRTTTLALLGLICLLALPLDPFAQVSPAPSRAPGCVVTDAPPPPTTAGDENFFTVPGGSVSNVMLLLDNSGSMQEFPREIVWQGYGTGSTQGTCAQTSIFTNMTTAVTLSATPYDNGWVTTDGNMTDNPPWGLTRCMAKQARPTTDNTWDYCLYRPASFYKYVKGANQGQGSFWDTTRAKVYNANPCAAVDSNGNVLTDYLGNVVTGDLAACAACLASKGFYQFRARYKTSATTYAASTEQLVFDGAFLNGYPQKHIAARKVVKDLVKMDQNVPDNVDGVRFGITIFTSASAGLPTTNFRTGDGGRLLVPLGPDCDTAYPLDTHKANFQAARQTLVDAVNAVNADATQSAKYVTFNTSTPLSETLFNIGQYFTNTGTSSPYSVMFGANWILPRTGDTRDFTETSRGLVTASWTGTGKNQHSYCWACQQSSVVVVTDGEPNIDSNLPSGNAAATAHSTFNNDFRYWTNSTIDCPACQCDLSYGDACSYAPLIYKSSTSQVPNTLHKVAYFLNQTDLRPDLINTPNPQNLLTYTISFGLDATATAPSADKKAIAVLQKTADLGGGKFANSSSGDELRDALRNAVVDVVSRATSFSAASANSLQTSKTTQADAYIARFKPTNALAWEGHLFASMIFDEFGQGCDARKTTANQALLSCGSKSNVNPNLNQDEDSSTGLALCNDAFPVDADCDPIVQDSNGAYKKGTFSSGTLIGTPDDAVMFWDAGRALSYPSDPGYRAAKEGLSNSRAIYTVIDTNGDGRFTSADGLTAFTRDNAATLAPFMSLDQTFCATMEASAGICGKAGTPACGTWNDTERARCARMVIDFVRGYDVLDWDSDHCGGPEDYENTHGWGSCTIASNCGTSNVTCTAGLCYNTACPSGEERDRTADSRATASQEFWKLGDIFHSSPVLVKPPVGKVECNTGLANQCVYTLYSTETGSPPMTSYGSSPGLMDAYVAWRKDNLNRQQLVVAGANDGMLHAFDAGSPITTKTPSAEGQYPYSNGNGGEVWAFIPPDLLPRLKNALVSHGYYVDGTPMVRDVWVDLNNDGEKSKNEYRTVAVISERSGGTHYSALDITDVKNPRFLWTFPESGGEDARLMAQTWNDFAPKPPPIGPVKLANGSGFSERWVVLLNGGYDPAMVRGRGIWMLDVYRGTTLWRFGDAEFKAMRGNNIASMGPVTASPAMIDMGKGDRVVGSTDNDGYFDTATFGDLFGNLFVARFWEPGVLSGGVVTNWSVSRTFEMNRKTTDAQDMRGRGSFFYMTGNMIDPPSKLMTLVGSGNRERLLVGGAECSADNLLGCCQAGCSVASAVTTATYGYGCSMGGTFTCNSGALTYTPAENAACATGPAATCGATTQSVAFTFNCGAAGTYGPLTGTLTCDANGACSVDSQPGTSSADAKLLAAPSRHDAMYGIWSYGFKAEKRFTESDTSSIRAFDANRFTDVTYGGTCGTFSSCSLVDASPALVQTTASNTLQTTCQNGAAKCWAENTDPGWKYSYGVYCPNDNCNTTAANTLPWFDEKTGSSIAGGYGSCVQYFTFRPISANGSSSDPCNGDKGTLTAYSYLVDPFLGTTTNSCGYHKPSSGTITHYRAQTLSSTSPPKTPTFRVSVNQKGEVSYSLIGDPSEGGGTGDKVRLGERSSTSEPLYMLEVPRTGHSCRHTPPETDSTKPAKCE